MLDLNLSVVNHDYDHYDSMMIQENGMDVEESMTCNLDNSSDCNSSNGAVTADVDDNNSSTATFNFDILKADRSTQLHLVTQQLFPVHDNNISNTWMSTCSSSSWSQSRFQPDQSHAGISFNQPQVDKAPVKKSRRGPRSRSSQYRGITFYRRTGRWESHIWYLSLYLTKSNILGVSQAGYCN